MNECLTFDDVQIIPGYSEILSRKQCNTKTQFTRNYSLDIPLVAAPMASICGGEMAREMLDLGGVGIIHRFNTIEEQVREVMIPLRGALDVENYSPPLVAAAIGCKGVDFERGKELVRNGVSVLVIDVAHGHHISTKHMLGALIGWRTFNQQYKFDIIAGNIATADAARDLNEWGADAIRVGIGGGSVCETRIRTGVGIPQISCLQEIVDASDVPILSCGGIRSPGDVAKAIAAGADTVMLGSMISGTDETPGDMMLSGHYGQRQKMKIYHGSASDVQKILTDSDLANIEGTAAMVAAKGPVEGIVNEVLEGLRSAMSYVGCDNLSDFYMKSEFVKVTTNGLKEATPHLL